MARSLKRFYSVAEVHKIVGEEVSTIKYWEREFPHLRPRTTPGGTRQYREADIEAIRVVKRLLRDKKLTIEGAREALKSKQDSLTLRENTLTRLNYCLERLRTLRRALD